MILKIARREVITARPDDSVKDVVGQMDYYNVGCVVIVEREKPVGIVTDRDLSLRILGTKTNGIHPKEMKISDVMTRRVQTVREDEGFDDAVERMVSAKVRRLPVVDRQGRLRGMISLDDIVDSIAADMTAIENLLKDQAEGPKRRSRTPVRSVALKK